MILRRQALATLRRSPGFDSDFHMYSEEMDLYRRIRDAGWSVRYLPDATVVHHGGQSTGQRHLAQPRLLWVSRVLYYRKHRPARAARLLADLIRTAYRLRGLAWTLRARTGPGEASAFWLGRAAVARALLRDLR